MTCTACDRTALSFGGKVEDIVDRRPRRRCLFGLVGCSSSSDEAAPSPTGPAKVSPPAILEADTLTICAPNDGTPPNVYHDESGKLVGSEVELGEALAAQMGLKAKFHESSFATVIPTLQAKQCDVIMAQLYIKPEREAVVDFVPYVLSGTGIAVSEDKPADITGMDDSLCGKKVVLAVATTAESLAQEQSEKCTAAGKPPVDITRSNQADVSIQQVQNGQADAFMDTAETLGYYATKTGAKITPVESRSAPSRLVPPRSRATPPCTTPSPRHSANFEANGTYKKILDEWGMSDLGLSS